MRNDWLMAGPVKLETNTEIQDINSFRLSAMDDGLSLPFEEFKCYVTNSAGVLSLLIHVGKQLLLTSKPRALLTCKIHRSRQKIKDIGFSGPSSTTRSPYRKNRSSSPAIKVD